MHESNASLLYDLKQIEILLRQRLQPSGAPTALESATTAEAIGRNIQRLESEHQRIVDTIKESQVCIKGLSGGDQEQDSLSQEQIRLVRERGEALIAQVMLPSSHTDSSRLLLKKPLKGRTRIPL